nr:DUF4865 family protein [Streptomyces sp. SID5468]
MSYEITLPADYDMAVIRHRVATRGAALDDFPGLAVKAYLIRERAAGSPVNQYAPFYLWRETSGMNRFLWGGGGFQGIVADFGRPAVRHWTGVGFAYGPARHGLPRTAVRSARPVPQGTDLTALAERELAALRRLSAAPGLHSAALAIDPHTWELIRFTLWEQAPADAPGEDGTRYEVLRLNTPELDALPAGRHW